MERISPGQLFPLMALFMLGSAWLFGLGSEAEENAWIAILLGLAAGLPLLGVYLTLHKQFPGQSLIQFLPVIAGRWLGKLLGLCYLLYFLYLGARVTRDFAELSVTALLPETPIAVVTAAQLCVIAYAVRYGLEVLGRAAQVLLPVAFGIVLLGTIFVTASFDLARLQPLLADGIWPVWQAAFPLTLTVPYGELILFGLVFPQVSGSYRKHAFGATLFAGLVLAYLSLIEMGVLGRHLLQTSQFPLLDLFRQIAVGDLLDRLDALIVLVMGVGGFMKVALFLYGTACGTAHWLGLKDYRPLVYPLAALTMALSFSAAGSYAEHIQIGLRRVPYLMHIPLQIVVPLLLLVVWQVRRWIGGRPTPSQSL